MLSTARLVSPRTRRLDSSCSKGGDNLLRLLMSKSTPFTRHPPNRGIEQALVEEAWRRGAKRVYAGTRQPLAHIDERVRSLTLDVTSAEQIQAAVQRVESLDVLPPLLIA